MDEINFKPAPKAEDSPNGNSEKKNYDMDSLDVNFSKPKDDSDFVAPLETNDINSLIEKEKKERQRSKEQANTPTETPAEANPPKPEKPKSAERSKEKIVEIMLTPPDEKTEDSKPVSDKKHSKAQTNPNKPAEKQGGKKADAKAEKPAETAEVPEKNIEKVKPADANSPKEIETLNIPEGLMAELKNNSKPVPAQSKESDIESISAKPPVFVDVDANVAQAKEPMSYDEEYKLLIQLEEKDSLSEDQKRRLQIMRLIDLKRKGKSNSFANDNLIALMGEERKLGHDISGFEKALDDMTSEATKVITPVSVAAKSEPIHKISAEQPAQKQAKSEEAKPKKQAPKAAVVNEASKASASDNKILFIIVAVLAVALVVVIILAIVSGINKNNAVVTDTTSTSIEETTPNESEEVSTPVETKVSEETTALISKNNLTQGTVKNVLYGDVIEVELNDGQTYTVKMIGIRCPKDKEYYASEAKAYTEKVIGDKTITLEFESVFYNDEEQLLAYVWCNDGKVLFNDELIILGYAKTSLGQGNIKFNEEFSKTEQEAKGDRKGLWGKKTTNVAAATTTAKATPAVTEQTVDPSMIADAPYVSRNMKVFHKNTCPLAYDTKYGKGLYSFSSREEAIEYGCQPCAQCKP